MLYGDYLDYWMKEYFEINYKYSITKRYKESFRNALHLRLSEYISRLDKTEFEKFLGLKSQELLERMKESEEVFRRLKERE